MAGNNRALTPALEQKGINEVFVKEYGKRVVGKVMTRDIFQMDKKARGMSETDVALAAVSEFQSTADQKNINKDEVLQRGTTLYQHTVYTNGITVSYAQKLADETGSDTIKRASQLAKAGRESQEKKRLGVLRDNPEVLDGENLFSTAHPLANGDTQSNDISFATNIYTTVKNMMSALRSQRQFQGDLSMAMDPKMLMCTEANFDAVVEVIGAKNSPDSDDDNSLNFVKTKFPGLVIGWNPYLGTAYGGNDKDLFMMAEKTDHKLKVMLREAMNTWFKNWMVSDNLDSEFNAKYVESFGASDYLGVVRGKSSA